MKAGKLTVIVGSMFSGKSTELLRQGKRHELGGKKVAYFYPRKDTRWVEDKITTHDGVTVSAYQVGKTDIILEMVRYFKEKVVCIDEVQFFDESIVRVINLLLMDGVDVIVSGLDMDRFGQPFGNVPQLLCMAEKVIKVTAVCSECGDDAWVSVGLFQSQDQVVIGEKDKYTAMCRTCYYKKGKLI